jgi:hypothetical protein
MLSTFALALAGHAIGEPQPARADYGGHRASELGQIMRRDHRYSARYDARLDDRIQQKDCAAALREYAKQYDELERRLRKEHQEWHRVHDTAGRDNFVRLHQVLHERLDRTRIEWQRQHPRPRCGSDRSQNRKRDDRNVRWGDDH